MDEEDLRLPSGAADLSLVPDGLLVEELQRRSDVCIVAFLRHDRERSNENSFFYHGGSAAAIGLCEWFKANLLEAARASMVQPDSEVEEEEE